MKDFRGTEGNEPSGPAALETFCDDGRRGICMLRFDGRFGIGTSFMEGRRGIASSLFGDERRGMACS